jgi:hypothetical protein
MRTLFIAIFVLTFASSLYSQTIADSTKTHTCQALTIQFDNFHFGGGIGGTYWISKNYSMLLTLNGFYDKYSNGPQQDRKEILFYPSISIKRHFVAHENVAPYFGGRLRMSWYIERIYGQRDTYLQLALLVGVESWVTDNISITGEQALGANYLMNGDSIADYRFSDATIFISFYF